MLSRSNIKLQLIEIVWYMNRDRKWNKIDWPKAISQIQGTLLCDSGAVVH